MILSRFSFPLDCYLCFVLSHLEAFDEEYRDYIERSKSICNKRMKRKVTDEESVKWVFLLGKYYKEKCDQDEKPCKLKYVQWRWCLAP
jgi:hypothetical protein